MSEERFFGCVDRVKMEYLSSISYWKVENRSDREGRCWKLEGDVSRNAFAAGTERPLVKYQ